jgi:hypothetical protein
MGVMPERIQLKRTRGWKMPPNTIKAGRGRGNPYGNPFRIGGWFKIGNGKPGGFNWIECLDEKYLEPGYVKVRDRAHAVELYREYRRLYPLKSDVIARLKAADYVACWCPLDGLPCHADVLLEIANA